MHLYKKIDKMLEEGLVSKSRSRAIRALNDKARRIYNFAEKLGLDPDVSEVASMTDDAVVEFQLGNNKKFKKSQVASVTVHDMDDYVVMLPMAVTMYLDVEGYKKLSSLLETKRYIKEIYQRLYD